MYVMSYILAEECRKRLREDGSSQSGGDKSIADVLKEANDGLEDAYRKLFKSETLAKLYQDNIDHAKEHHYCPTCGADFQDEEDKVVEELKLKYLNPNLEKSERFRGELDLKKRRKNQLASLEGVKFQADEFDAQIASFSAEIDKAQNALNEATAKADKVCVHVFVIICSSSRILQILKRAATHSSSSRPKLSHYLACSWILMPLVTV